MTKQRQKTPEEYAKEEYQRLIGLYREAGADEIKLRINDSLIRKVAETFGILESIKALPTVCYDQRNRALQKETAAGKVRVKYMAQYSSAMQKLNRELLGAVNDDDAELDDYE